MKILKNYQALRYIVIVMALEIVAISINFFMHRQKLLLVAQLDWLF